MRLHLVIEAIRVSRSSFGSVRLLSMGWKHIGDFYWFFVISICLAIVTGGWSGGQINSWRTQAGLAVQRFETVCLWCTTWTWGLNNLRYVDTLSVVTHFLSKVCKWRECVLAFFLLKFQHFIRPFGLEPRWQLFDKTLNLWRVIKDLETQNVFACNFHLLKEVTEFF